jgi:release factor glutamine methyltransferase
MNVDQAKLPSLDHLLMEDYDQVYEPSEDTYLMCDALKADETLLKSIVTSSTDIILEIGSGSGCNITYLTTLLNHQCKSIATDINPNAISVTNRTAIANSCSIETIQCDLIHGIDIESIKNNLCVLLFNPPYVPTPDDEVGTNDVAASWAGGIDGRRVIDRFLPLLPLLLKKPTSKTTSPNSGSTGSTGCGGMCYLILVEENKPKEISEILKTAYGLDSEIVMKKRARNEGLQVMRIQWPSGAVEATE